MDLNWKFMLPVTFHTVIWTIYTWVTVAVAKNLNSLSSAFYRLFIVGYFMNLATYSNSFLTLRIPQITGINGSQAQFFLTRNRATADTFLSTSIIHALSLHFAYTQYIYGMLVCLNRFTLVYQPHSSEKIWRKYLWAIASAMFGVPVVFTSWIAVNDSFFIYNKPTDSFFIASTLGRTVIWGCLAATITFITFLNAFLNIWSYRIVKNMKRNKVKIPESQLMKMSILIFIVDAFTAAISLSNVIIMTWTPIAEIDKESWAYIASELTPLGSDILTFSPPILLLMYSRTTRYYSLEMMPCMKTYLKHPMIAKTKSLAIVEPFHPESIY